MLNMFKVRRFIAFLFASLVPAMTFHILFLYYNFMYATLGFTVSMVIMFLVGGILTSNPFTKMLEGQGVLALNLDSTGIIDFFLVKINQPYLRGKLGGEEIKDVFDRNSVFSASTPKISKSNAKWEKDKDSGKNKLKFELTEDELNKSRFGFFHFPCLIYNSMIKSFITKDFLSEKENGTFAKHQVLYMNRQMEELSSVIRDFSRSVADKLRPVTDIFKSSYFWIILIILFIILAVLFAPKILAVLQGQINISAGNALSEVVTPRG